MATHMSIIRDATLSPCGLYRFTLMRQIKGGFGTGSVLFILNNPSVADGRIDDPTCKRGMAFAASWSYSTLWFVNTNPCRATDPDEAHVPAESILAENDYHLLSLANECSLVVAAWGDRANPVLRERALAVVRQVSRIRVLGLTKAGNPRHPLYLKGNLIPRPWLNVL